MTSTASSKSSLRSSKSTPRAANSERRYPVPRTKVARPPDRTSTAVMDLAVRNGLRYGTTHRDVRTLIVVVAAAKKPRPTKGPTVSWPPPQTHSLQGPGG